MLFYHFNYAIIYKINSRKTKISEFRLVHEKCNILYDYIVEIHFGHFHGKKGRFILRRFRKLFSNFASFFPKFYKRQFYLHKITLSLIIADK